MHHHTVPRVYLRGFAAEKGRLWAFDVHNGNSFGINVDKATAQNNFYATPDHPDGIHSFEHVLGRMEGELGAVVKGVRSGSWPLGSNARAQLASFMALQFLRGFDARKQVGQVIARTLEHLANADPDALARLQLLDGAFDELGVSPVPEKLVQSVHIGIVHKYLADLAGVILGRKWTLVRFDAPALITSDAPLVPMPDKNALKQDVALGLGTAPQLLYPLDRFTGLRMTRLYDRLTATTNEALYAGRVDDERTGRALDQSDINAHLATFAHQKLYFHPDDKGLVPADALARRRRGGRIDFSAAIDLHVTD